MSGPYIYTDYCEAFYTQQVDKLFMLQPKLNFLQADPDGEYAYTSDTDLDRGLWYTSLYTMYEVNLKTDQVTVHTPSFPRPVSDLVAARNRLYYIDKDSRLLIIDPRTMTYETVQLSWPLQLALAEYSNDQYIGTSLEPYNGRLMIRMTTDGTNLYLFVEAGVGTSPVIRSGRTVQMPVYGSFNMTYNLDSGLTDASYELIENTDFGAAQVPLVPYATKWTHYGKVGYLMQISKPFYYRGCILALRDDFEFGITLDISRLSDGWYTSMPQCGFESGDLYDELLDNTTYDVSQSLMAGNVLYLYGRKFTAIGLTGLPGISAGFQRLATAACVVRAQTPLPFKSNAAIKILTAAPQKLYRPLIGLLRTATHSDGTLDCAAVTRCGVNNQTTTF